MKGRALLVLAFASVLAVAGSGRFPSTDPDPRVGTPDDPDFDCAEPDNEDTGEGHDCGNQVFEEQANLFGFAPNATKNTATYKDAARFGQGQVSGVYADVAWKTTVGLPQVSIAILDTGMRWDRNYLRRKIRLNRFELPRPQDSSGGERNNAADRVWDGYDANGDGAFNVDDYAADPRVNVNGGPRGMADLVDAQDLIVAFSDGTDADANGYVDDIAGWDFFEDDNDPDDTTSYSAAGNHGTGRASDAAEETDDGEGSAGVCPKCQVVPLRVWDTFVSPGDTYAAATAYAADLGVQVQEVALGVMQNTRAAKAATTYAFDKGMALMQVSSDLNTADHNYPTNYVETVYINGCVADSHGGSSELPALGDFVPVTLNVPVMTWFRNSGLTQFGAHAHVCFVGTTGSIDTGQAAGGAGLIHSRGIEVADAIGGPLSSNEVKQLMTLTAEDVLEANTVGIGIPDPAQEGWDEHFGYGRANLGAAVQRVAPGKIPPEALIQSPAWWAILDPEAGDAITIAGLAAARRSSGCTYRLEYAAGVEPPNDGFTEFASGDCPEDQNQGLGELPLGEIADAIPGSRDGTFTTTPLTRPNPNQHVFTVRLVVEDADGNRGEDRKAYFAHHDPTWHEGWPKFVDVGGETSPLLYDLDGDGALEFIDANSGGELWVYRHDGTSLPSFNGGQPWILPPAFFHHPDAPAFKSGAVPPVNSGLRSPSVADLDGDFEPEIVAASSDGRLYVLRADGSVRLQLGVDPEKSTRDKRNEVDHPKRGFSASPTLADLDADGVKEIVIAGLDGWIYAWDGATGVAKPGFPAEIRESPAPENLDARGELIATVSVGNIDADPELEIVTGSSDFIPAEAAAPTTAPPILGGSNALVAWLLSFTAGGQTRVYALNHDGSFVEGWPRPITGLLGDVLPFVGPQHATAIADLDSDGVDDVVAGMTTGDVNLFMGDGSVKFPTSTGVVNGGVNASQPGLPAEPTRVFNLFEYPAIGNLDGRGGLDLAKAGMTAPQLLNLLLVGQNVPFNFVIQAWDSSVPEAYLPGYPTAHDDYALLSTPAIANVDGAGNAEILAGSGLYLLHAYNSLGTDAPGFPKLAGGWIFSVPAVGDVDGDGLLELVAGTREGWRFVWDLEAPASAENNSEWWMEGHDECHTNNYGSDCRPPNAVKDLRFERGALRFTAPGDDWGAGTVTRYELRTADQPIATFAEWKAARVLPDILPAVAGGKAEALGVDLAKAGAYVAISAVDDAGNHGRIVGITTKEAPRVVVTPAPAKDQSRFGGSMGLFQLLLLVLVAGLPPLRGFIARGRVGVGAVGREGTPTPTLPRAMKPRRGGRQALALTFALIPGLALAQSKVKAGVGVVDDTWNVGACAGQYCEYNGDAQNLLIPGEVDPFAFHRLKERSYGVQSRLTARAIVIEGSNGRRIALLKTDNYLAQDMLVRRVGQILDANGTSGVSYDDILYHVTHNHSTPYYATLSWGAWVFQDVYDQRAFEFQARKMAEAIEIAAANLKPARMGATVVRHTLFKGNIVRPSVADDGTPAGYPLEYGDHGLTVLRFDDVSDPSSPEPIATWVNFGQHPEGLDTYQMHSADFLAPLERMVGRETGAPLVFSQGDVGSSESSGNERQLLDDAGRVCGNFPTDAETPDVNDCPPGQGTLRDIAHEGYAQTERNVRYLADAVVEGFDRIGAGDALVPFTEDFEVDAVNAWVPGPVSHPYPSVSNCRTDTTLEGSVGVPVLGLPDCARYGDAVTEPLMPAFNGISQVAGMLRAAGVPVPDHYDFTGFLAVEENIRLRLQAFRLGDILLASCACEAQNDLILNIKSRADKVAGNIYDGFDWACLLPEYAGEAVCEQQKQYYDPAEFPTNIPGDNFDPAAIAKLRAQVHNDARGWDDPANALRANSEPVDITQIWGNFTKEELPPELGYTLPVGVGHAGDYNGYTISYREYMNRDSYRKALTSYGPHTADYMATRLVRMAASMKGAPPLAAEFLQPVGTVDELRQAALATVLGQLTSVAWQAWEAVTPNDVGPARAVTQPSNVEHFNAAVFGWVGGGTATDNPVARVERETAPGVWEAFADMSGEVQTRVRFPEGLVGVAGTYTGQHEWQWSANFEAYAAHPARLGSVPFGRYRFVVDGLIRQARTPTPYHLESEPFLVGPWGGMTVADVAVDGAGNLAFRVPEAQYPRSYSTDFPFPADDGGKRICRPCTFRPWAQGGAVESVNVTVQRGAGAPVVLVAVRGADDAWTAPAGLGAGDRAWIAPGGIVDVNGETNREAIPLSGEAPAPASKDVTRFGGSLGLWFLPLLLMRRRKH